MKTLGTIVLAIAFALAAAFVAVEGTSSLVLFGIAAWRHQSAGFNQGLPTRYDADLGWTNRPNASLADAGGKTFLRINAQGARADHDFSAEPPPGKLRVLCLGDSMTFGYGVDDEHVWCRLLGDRDRRLETVNMGQSAYGLDQIYLSYVRDGGSLAHGVEVLGLVTDEFYRMNATQYAGRGKPVLRLVGDHLAPSNVPVPDVPFTPPAWRRFQIAAKDLRASELFKMIRGREPKDERRNASADEAAWTVAARALADLAERSAAHRSTLVIVYLPTERDYFNRESDPWRERVRQMATRANIAYVDLVPSFREMTVDRVKSLILQGEAPLAGHYSEDGNAWVADRLYESLMAMPSVAASVARAGDRR